VQSLIVGADSLQQATAPPLLALSAVKMQWRIVGEECAWQSTALPSQSGQGPYARPLRTVMSLSTEKALSPEENMNPR